MAEKDFKVDIHLNDTEFCNGCPFVVSFEGSDDIKVKCNLFKKVLSYDVRRRIERTRECIDAYGI